MQKTYTIRFFKKTLITCLLTIFIYLPASATETRNYRSTVHIAEYSTDTATDSDDLWERIRNGFTLGDLNSKEVRSNEASYTRDPDYIYRIAERSKRYLHHIVEEVERRGMPTEIALLPIIESAFNPNAESSSNAAGLWQFIPATGKSFGLKQNWWRDERKDIIAATHAALDYLQNLYGMFGDWKLAIAAYNWGEGAIKRSLAKNREEGFPTSFRHIKLPPETRNHVHKLIAVKNIIANPTDYGIELNPIPNEPYFDKVEANHHIDISLVAELAGIPIEEFNALNPAYNRPIIRVNDTPRILLLPIDKIETFLTNLESCNKPLVSWQIYQVKRGEDARELSSRHNISVAQLKEVNSITQNDKITQGQVILVPRIESGHNMDTLIAHNKSTKNIKYLSKGNF